MLVYIKIQYVENTYSMRSPVVIGILHTCMCALESQ
jgi:hypothetical protein